MVDYLECFFVVISIGFFYCIIVFVIRGMILYFYKNYCVMVVRYVMLFNL